jgi:hypothetical protein
MYIYIYKRCLQSYVGSLLRWFFVISLYSDSDEFFRGAPGLAWGGEALVYGCV